MMNEEFKKSMINLYVAINNKAANDVALYEVACDVMKIVGQVLEKTYETERKGFRVPTKPSGVVLDVNSWRDILENGIFRGGNNA